MSTKWFMNCNIYMRNQFFTQIIDSLKVIWTTFYPSTFYLLKKDNWVFFGFSKILSNINDNGTFLKYCWC